VQFSRKNNAQLGHYIMAGSLFIGSLCLAAEVRAHEVWLTPHSYYGKAQTQVQVDILNGQNFVGDALRYRPNKIEALGFLTETDMLPVTGRLGDQPAIQTRTPMAGQNILIYQSQPEKLFYKKFDKFADFVTEKADKTLLEIHRKLGLPEAGFTEIYTRFAKTLLVRDITKEGQLDRYSGMEVEFVLEKTWLHKGAATSLPIRIFYQGRPLAGAKVTVFEKSPDSKTSRKIHIADKGGYVYVMPVSGYEYLIDHVTIRPIEPDKNIYGAVWESLWASLTFKGF
jgi:hypothetical protein